MNARKRLFVQIAIVELLILMLAAGLLLTETPVRALAWNIAGMADDMLEGLDSPLTGETRRRASEAALRFTGEGYVIETEASDEDRYYEVEVILDNGQEVDVNLDGNFHIPGQQSGADGSGDTKGANGPDSLLAVVENASHAALAFLGEGRVTELEVGDQDGYYEVEILLDDGQEVDVLLDERFNVLGQKADGDDKEN
jgi:uncharacterized membrane protein YkoI